jgi:hypothetical protein
MVGCSCIKSIKLQKQDQHSHRIQTIELKSDGSCFYFAKKIFKIHTWTDVVVTHAISTQWFQSCECVVGHKLPKYSYIVCFLAQLYTSNPNQLCMHRMCVFYKESKPIILNSCAYTLSLIFVCLIWEFIIFHYTLWRRFGKKNKGYSLFRQSLSISAIEIFL